MAFVRVCIFLSADVTQPCGFEEPLVPRAEAQLCAQAALTQGNDHVLCIGMRASNTLPRASGLNLNRTEGGKRKEPFGSVLIF